MNTKWDPHWLAAAMLGLTLTLAGCGTTHPAKPTQGSVTVQTSQLAGSVERWPGMAFDAAGKLLCVTWTIRPKGSPDTLGYAILDERGVVRSSSTTPGDTNLVSKFPALAVQLSLPSLVRQAGSTNYFLEKGMRTVAPDTSWLATIHNTNCFVVTVELWRLKPVLEKAWSWSHPGGWSPAAKLAAFRWHDKDLLAVHAGDKLAVLDVLSGAEVHWIPYAKQGEESYTPSCICPIPELGLVAFSSTESKRVRLRSLDPPHAVVREVGSKGVNWLGVPWHATALQTARNGRWLLRDSSYSSRYFPYKHEFVIIDLETSNEIRRWTDADEVALSPDGTRVAICRAGVIQIIPFQPKS
jgi:hypothetical protein